jgi:hypothetical protein
MARRASRLIACSTAFERVSLNDTTSTLLGRDVERDRNDRDVPRLVVQPAQRPADDRRLPHAATANLDAPRGRATFCHAASF